MDNQDLRLAVLIDADNAPRSALRDIMAEAAVYGTPTVKRIYGDWTTPNMASWKPLLLEHAITPIQQYSYTTGKNATDSAMIIDAMDLLYSGRCDGFVLVSSDSDFTRLATRLREAGMKVYGMGEKKTPLPFIVACDKFIYIEVIRAAGEKARQEALAASMPEPEPVPEPEKENQAQSAKKPAKKAAKKKAPSAQPQPPEPEEIAGVPRVVVDLIADSLESIADEDGYGFMGKLGNLLLKKQPDFDPRNYGYSKLTQLVKALDRFEVVSRQTSADDPTKHVYLRDKNRK
ncbi:MAG: NYN domain-containing protein [Pseudoflavonifractor capillosus]|uniref:NYN domain-containing protein n=1 Tax=Pseudoflavonifractor capillosus TaxID=106588 RepID=UPI0023F8BF3E|nr:NYN domain-containing protein [Pseudoflavonifractor capillosus]MCI5927136.1 NYN domain-containing protein [Pseudoflavonifractor capillosus]MDY4661850.1 NYN domain-containing protein [Pseudoflavonifractor capillosus]